VPYRDFFVEYPPGAFVVFTPPALLPDGWYLHAFKASMALFGLAMLFVAGLVLARLGAGACRLYGTLFALALTPLAVGPVLLNTYDLWPALLVAAGLAALLYGRDVLSFGLLGAAFAAKLYAIALLPLFCLWLWRRDRSLARPLAGLGVVSLALVAPFAMLGWGGLVDSVDAQAGRGLQIESPPAAFLLAAHRLGTYEAEVTAGATAALSRDMAGGLPDALVIAATLAQVAAVALVALLFARGRPEGERLVLAAAATLAGFLAFTRFLSPQYVIWLLPVVPLVAGRSGVAAAVALGAALVLGRLWFFHYRDVFGLDGIVWLVVLRDGLLAGLYGVLVVALLRTKTPSSSNSVAQEPLRSSSARGTAVVDAAERRSR